MSTVNPRHDEQGAARGDAPARAVTLAAATARGGSTKNAHGAAHERDRRRAEWPRLGGADYAIRNPARPGAARWRRSPIRRAPMYPRRWTPRKLERGRGPPRRDRSEEPSCSGLPSCWRRRRASSRGSSRWSRARRSRKRQVRSDGQRPKRGSWPARRAGPTGFTFPSEQAGIVLSDGRRTARHRRRDLSVEFPGRDAGAARSRPRSRWETPSSSSRPA